MIPRFLLFKNTRLQRLRPWRVSTKRQSLGEGWSSIVISLRSVLSHASHMAAAGCREQELQPRQTAAVRPPRLFLDLLSQLALLEVPQSLSPLSQNWGWLEVGPQAAV